MGPAADEAIRAIGDSGARVVFLALGAPKQERFAARAQRALPAAGFLSIGAGLDFVSGAQVRAPAWVRAIAAEWLWRLAHEPRRLAGRLWGLHRCAAGADREGAGGTQGARGMSVEIVVSITIPHGAMTIAAAQSCWLGPTLACVQAVVVIVDNASGDGSADQIADWIDR